MTSSSLCSARSDEKTIETKRKVVAKKTGMNAGCMTSHTVCTSSERDRKSK